MAYNSEMSRRRTWVERAEMGIGSASGFIRQVVTKCRQDDCFGLAGEMAYQLLWSLVPALIFLVSLVGLIGKQSELIPVALDVIRQLAPPHTILLLEQTLAAVVTGSSEGLTVLSLLLTLWPASNSAFVLIKGLDRAYDLPNLQMGYWRQRWMAVGIVLSLGIILVLASNLVVLGHVIVQWVYTQFHISWNRLQMLQLVGWLVTIATLCGSSAVAYAFLPSHHGKKLYWQGSFPGSVTFVSLWFTFSYLFGFYIGHFQDLNPIYGSLGAIAILMTWLYFSALALLIGGEVSAILAKLPQEPGSV